MSCVLSGVDKRRGSHIGRALLRPAALACTLAAVLWLAEGSYIHLKALVGQQLIRHAWLHSGGADSPRKPWPWMDTWPVARLRVPRLEVDQIVLAGDSGQALAFGPGHRSDSAPPGSGGLTLISGHRDTHFRFVARLQSGDILTLAPRPGGQPLAYEVTDTAVVPADFRLASDGGERLVLATCWPPGTALAQATERYLVFARPVPMPLRAAGTADASSR